MIYSFENEKLIEHSILTLAFSTKIFGPPSRRSVINKFYVSANLMIDRKLFREIIETSYFLHDIGKAFSWYQERGNLRSFSYHEILSSKIVIETIRMIRSKLRLEIPDDLMYLIVTSVLLHHQAMRNLRIYFERRSIIREKIKEILSNRPRIRNEDEKDIIILSYELSQIVSGIEVQEFTNHLMKTMENVGLEETMSLLKRIEDFTGNMRLFKLLPLILVPLQLADSIAASLLRPSAFSRISKEVLKAIEARNEMIKLFG